MTLAVRSYLLELQERIISALEAFDGKSFRRDVWERAAGGGGTSCVIEDGNFFERGGVSFSHVLGRSLPVSASARRPDLAGAAFEAMGVSLVLHPRNPYCPTVHMNVRYFVAYPEAGRRGTSCYAAAPCPNQSVTVQDLADHAQADGAVWWFGGGMDLTPYYPFEEDARHFHRHCRDALMPFGAELYPRFKAGCDKYFFLKHRNEARGIGGIFFDDFSEGGFPHSFGIMSSVGNAFLGAYLPIIGHRRALPYGERERDFQSYRRGRYVEFNLVHDRGTLFGLQSGGRTESILMSLPPVVSWRYDWHPAPGSPEAALYTDFLPVRDWI